MPWVSRAMLALTAVAVTACTHSAPTGSKPYQSTPGTSRPAAPSPSHLVAAVMHGLAPAGRRQMGGVTEIASPVTVSADQNETFEPAPANNRPTLTLAEAWLRLHHGKAISLPPEAIVRIGLLTSPQDHITRQLAYGLLSGPYGCIQTGIPAPSPPGHCLDWNFIDANTGRFLATVQVRLG